MDWQCLTLLGGGTSILRYWGTLDDFVLFDPDFIFFGPRRGTFWNEKRLHTFGFAFLLSSWSSCPMLRISAHFSSFTTFGKIHRLYRNS
jgi:hypothetical protein